MPFTFTPNIPPNRRILVIDDNPRIHQDIAKVLAPTVAAGQDALAPLPPIFGDIAHPILPEPSHSYELSNAFQGEEGVALARAAAAAGAPFAMAIVDCRIPPGQDGIQTIRQLWDHCPDLQVVLCTAYSDYSCEAINRLLGDTDNLMVLKKPFDVLELQQLAGALTRRWLHDAEARARLDELARQADVALQTRLEEDHRVAEQVRKAELAVERIQSVERLLALTFACSTRLATRPPASTRTATLRRLAQVLRIHHSQLGAFGGKLPAFLARLSEEFAADETALHQQLSGLRTNLERLRAALAAQTKSSSPANAAEPASAAETTATPA